MLTLTVPHSGDVRHDLRTLPRAWKRFRRWLWLFFKHEHRLDKELLGHVAFMRVTETTAGQKNDGHAHYHVYFHSPYIPHELARHLWGKALRQLGYDTPTRPIADVLAGARSEFSAAQLQRVLATRRGAKRLPEEVAWPVIDIEEAYGNIERELVKYLVKDAELEDGAMKLIQPELYARIYEGLEGLRTIATSRHFFATSGLPVPAINAAARASLASYPSPARKLRRLIPRRIPSRKGALPDDGPRPADHDLRHGQGCHARARLFSFARLPAPAARLR